MLKRPNLATLLITLLKTLNFKTMGYITKHTISIISHPPHVQPKRVIQQFESEYEGVYLTNFTGGLEFGDYDIDSVICEFSKVFPDTVFALTGVCKEERDVIYWRRYYKKGAMYEVDGGVIYEEFDESNLHKNESLSDIDLQPEIDVDIIERKSIHTTKRNISIYHNPTSISDESLMSRIEENIHTDIYIYHITTNSRVSTHMIDFSKKYPNVVFVINERKLPQNFNPLDGMCRENDIHYYRTYYRNGNHYQLVGELPTDIFESGIPENIDELVVFDEFDESKLK